MLYEGSLHFIYCLRHRQIAVQAGSAPTVLQVQLLSHGTQVSVLMVRFAYLVCCPGANITPAALREFLTPEQLQRVSTQLGINPVRDVHIRHDDSALGPCIMMLCLRTSMLQTCRYGGRLVVAYDHERGEGLELALPLLLFSKACSSWLQGLRVGAAAVCRRRWLKRSGRPYGDARRARSGRTSSPGSSPW